MARNGKIARMSLDIRNELNRRLQDGESGVTLLKWLNSKAGVRELLAEQFGGQPVNEQNLSDCLQGGYKDWLWQEEAKEMARDMAEETAELQAPGLLSLTDQMASWVTVRYLMAVRKLIEASQDKEPDVKTLRNFLHDVVMVRRGDHSGARVKLEQERMKREQEKTDAEVAAHFQEWVEFPKVREVIREEGLTRQERQERLAELFNPSAAAEEVSDSKVHGPGSKGQGAAWAGRPTMKAKADDAPGVAQPVDKMVGRPPSSAKAAVAAPPGEGETLAASGREPASGSKKSQGNGRSKSGPIKPDQGKSRQKNETRLKIKVQSPGFKIEGSGRAEEPPEPNMPRLNGSSLSHYAFIQNFASQTDSNVADFEMARADVHG